MTIKKKFIFYFFIIFFVVVLFSAYLIWVGYRINRYINSELPLAINEVKKASELDNVAQLIRYDDEVLTQSARNYAFTGEKKWSDRYNEFVPKLDLRIKQAIEDGDQEDKMIFESINDANLALVDFEVKSMAYVDADILSSAQEVLNSDEYGRQKAIFKAGIDKYLARRGASFDSAQAVTTNTLEEVQFNLNYLIKIQTLIILGFVVLFVFILFFLMFLIVKTFMKPLSIFKQAAKDITKGKLKTRIQIKNSKDEIGDFSVDFNKMTKTLEDSIKNVEKKVKERTGQLEKINRYMTGRELKMIELKKKIKELAEKNNEN